MLRYYLKIAILKRREKSEIEKSLFFNLKFHLKFYNPILLSLIEVVCEDSLEISENIFDADSTCLPLIITRN